MVVSRGHNQPVQVGQTWKGSYSCPPRIIFVCLWASVKVFINIFSVFNFHVPKLYIVHVFVDFTHCSDHFSTSSRKQVSLPIDKLFTK